MSHANGLAAARDGTRERNFTWRREENVRQRYQLKLETEGGIMQHGGMGQPLQVLHLEDNPDYSSLLSAKLAADGMAAEVLCVGTREDFQTALDRGGYIEPNRPG